MKYIVDKFTKKVKKLIECIDCVYFRDDYNDWDICSLYDKPRDERDFCSRAKEKERKERYRDDI